MGKVGTKRKDNWTPGENAILIQIILTGTREGKKIHQTIEEASNRLGNRTYDACYRHWSANIRRDHLAAYNHAKAEGLLGRTIDIKV